MWFNWLTMNNIIFQLEKLPEKFNEPRYLPVLNREELFRYKSFSDIMRKRQFLFSRFLLKNKLFEITGENSSETYFEIGPHGKPFLKNNRIHFSISHSENYVSYVIAKKPIGLDIQVQRPFSNVDALIKKICHIAESDILLSSEKKEDLLLKLWSLKEAYSKCTGFGIQVSFKDLDFSKLLTNPDETFMENLNQKNYELLHKVVEQEQKIFVSIFKETH